MATTLTYPSGGNTYVANFEASNKLQIEFARNPTDFARNKYVRTIPVKQDRGLYLRIDPTGNFRLRNTGLADFLWPKGNEAPTGDWNKQGFIWDEYLTRRYAFPYMIPMDAVDQASWDVLASHGRMTAQLAMTARTQYGVTVMTTAGNWGANTDTCTNIAGGLLTTAATTTTLYVNKLFTNVSIAIQKATGGAVKQGAIRAVMNPLTASKIRQTPELIANVIQSRFAMNNLQNRLGESRQQSLYGLPDFLYGVEIVVEDAVKDTTEKNASATSPAWVFPDNVIVFLSRTGDQVGSAGPADISTLQEFVYEDMTVESFTDTNNRRYAARIVDDYDIRITSAITGYYVTGLFS